MFSIYKITNKINGKIYIGQTTVHPMSRLRRHIYKSKSPEFPINFAFAKYGENNFTFEVIAFAKSQKSLDEAEIFYISHYNSCSYKIGYNLDKGGSHGEHSDETKLKISQSLTGHTMTTDTKSKISQSKIGSTISEELKNKMSKSLKGHTPWNKGITYSNENLKGRKHTPEHIEKNRASHIGKTMGENNGNSAISDDNLKLLLEDLKFGNYKQYILAEKYNVSSATVSRIKRKGTR